MKPLGPSPTSSWPTSPQGKTISDMLKGMTLERASTLMDEIKEWDKTHQPGALNPPVPQDIQIQMQAFWNANRAVIPGRGIAHDTYHYTDVPCLTGKETYGDSKVGESPSDIIHVITYCINVLDGKVPENNDKKITKAVAFILLAHLMGDLHQPMHVGAIYFQKNGTPFDPRPGDSFDETRGGNLIKLEGHSNLHAYWDGDAVRQAYDLLKVEMPQGLPGNSLREKIAGFLAGQEPRGYKPPEGKKPQEWAELWANEIIPIASEAHTRLALQRMSPVSFTAKPREMPDHKSYEEWSGAVTRELLQRGGWRLAFVLQSLVK